MAITEVIVLIVIIIVAMKLRKIIEKYEETN